MEKNVKWKEEERRTRYGALKLKVLGHTWDTCDEFRCMLRAIATSLRQYYFIHSMRHLSRGTDIYRMKASCFESIFATG